eukprot:1810212-Amphidinium_carterae.2
MGWGEGQSGAGGKGFKVLPANAASTVWIGGVPAGITHDEIKRNFEAAGSVKRVQLMGSSGTGSALRSFRQIEPFAGVCVYYALQVVRGI